MVGFGIVLWCSCCCIGSVGIAGVGSCGAVCGITFGQFDDGWGSFVLG